VAWLQEATEESHKRSLTMAGIGAGDAMGISQARRQRDDQPGELVSSSSFRDDAQAKGLAEAAIAFQTGC
jgi:hypothetical protein